MSPVLVDHAPLLERAFAFEPEEGEYRLEVEGVVPAFVRGTYYLAGPGRFQRGDLRYRHWLDGDGMVTALRFDGEGIHFQHRFVQGSKWSEEEAAGRALYRTFGTSFEEDQLVRGVALASPLNVSAYAFGDSLLAFGEQGLPWELDPVTLETRGEYTFGRRLNAVSPFSAHPHIDHSGELLNFGISFSARQPLLQLYRFDGQGTMVYRKRLPIEHPCSVHDFSVSRSHIAVYLSPYLLDMSAMMAGKNLSQALRWEPERGSQLLIAERETGDFLGLVATGRAYCLHMTNSFEEGEHLVVDVVELQQPVYDQYQVPELFPDVRTAEQVRYVVDLNLLQVVDRQTLDYGLMCDFPAIDPRRSGLPTEDFWLLGISATHQQGRKFFDQVVHCNWQSGETEIYEAPEACYFGGEPILLPDPSEERGGVVICQQFDAQTSKSSFLLFDALRVSAGPVATLPLQKPIRLGFHASFCPQEAAVES